MSEVGGIRVEIEEIIRVRLVGDQAMAGRGEAEGELKGEGDGAEQEEEGAGEEEAEGEEVGEGGPEKGTKTVGTPMWLIARASGAGSTSIPFV